MSSSADFDEDLDAFAESIAKRTADRESRLQRFAMLKRQQLENDEEEFQKSKKQASSTTNVISSSNSPAVKSPQKPTTPSVFNYSSPSKTHQFLPSFNSPQRSFVLTRSIEKSPQKDLLSTTTPECTNVKTPLNSPEKPQEPYLSTTPLQSASNSTINICSPKPYQKSPKSPIKSPYKPFMSTNSPSQASIASNFTKKVVDFSINQQQSPTKSVSSLSTTGSVEETTPTKSPVKSFLDKQLSTQQAPQQTKSTSSMPTTGGFSAVSTNKRSISPVRLFSSVKSSNPIKVVSPIKQNGVNTPEKLCVSDKKKLFENAIKEETENAKRVQEQKIFLLRKKLPGSQDHEQPSMPKKIKTSIFEFENRMMNDSPRPSWTPKSTTKIEIRAQATRSEIEHTPQPTTPVNTEPRILDVEMKQTSIEDYSVRPGDEISKFIEQAEITAINVSQSNNRTMQLENSLHSIAEEDENNQSQSPSQDKEKQMLDDDHFDKDDVLVKSSTKANLYPSLAVLNEEPDVHKPATSDLFTQQQANVFKQTPTIQARTNVPAKSPSKPSETVSSPTTDVTSAIKKQQQAKPTTPMRTLSQYRREQKQRAASNSTPSNKLDLEKVRMKEEMERARWTIYQAELKAQLEKLKVLVDKYEKAIEQSSNAIALCLKNPDQRGSSSQLAAEQILLVSTQRRVACKQQMELIENKMRSQLCRAPEEPLAKGCITIERIQIPLKGDFIVGQVSDQDPLNHHFICLASCGETVQETELLDSANSIQQASIIFDLNKLQFKELDKDFEIHFELYGLAMPKEKIHHHDKKSLLMSSIKLPPLSPKLHRSKKAANQMSTYSVNQGFTRLGFVKFDWNNILDKKYDLEEFMPNSPFNGQIEVDFKMSAVYSPDYQLEDFLNMYDGRYWKSRYYVLKGYLIAYWNYKEDYADKNLPSLGTIDLRKCVNRRVGSVSLNVCPRSYSFVLVTEEEILDKNHKYNDNKVHKITEQRMNTFAADSKEDFDRWCDHFNKLLPLIRIWEDSAKPPQDLKFLEQ